MPTVLTFAPADTLAPAGVTVYYHATSSSATPTQCGTGTVGASGSASVTCTFPETAVYVYARVTSGSSQGALLRSDASGTGVDYPVTLLLPATPIIVAGCPRYAKTVPLATALTLWDLSLGSGVYPDYGPTYGYIGRFRDAVKTANRTIWYSPNSYPAYQRGNINHTERVDAGIEPGNVFSLCPNGFGPTNEYYGDPGAQFDYYRWGYKISVRPNKLWYATQQYGGTGNTANASITLRGYPDSTFNDATSDILYNGPITDRDSYASQGSYFAFNNAAIAGNTTGWKYFQIKNTSPTTSGFTSLTMQLLLAL